jgi:hypothetical protein
MAQFLTNRMSDTTFLKDVDDNYQDLEDAFVYFFGMPVDTPFYQRTMFADADGVITSILRYAAAPGTNAGPGWRFRDTTNDDEFLIMANDGYLRLYRNAGSQVSPSWVEENKMALDDGVWDVVSAGDVGTGCAIYEPYGLQDFRTEQMMDFEFEFFDDGSYWSTGARDRFIVPAAGRYNVQWSAFHGTAGLHHYEVELMTTLYLNGSPVMTMGSGQKEEVEPGGSPVHPGVGVGGEWTFGALSASDYIQFGFEIWSYNDDATYLHSGHAMIERIA